MRKTWSLLLLFVILTLLSGCLGKPISGSGDEKASENIPKKHLASKIPTDNELFTVIEANAHAFNQNDLASYMETIHSQSPVYDTTEADIKALMETYAFHAEVSDLKVIEKSKNHAIVSFKQTTVQLEGPPTQNTETTGTHTLKPEKGTWKITSTAITSTIYLDELGSPLEENTEAYGTTSYKYREIMEMLNFYVDDRKWNENYYEENEGTALAEFMLEGETPERWTELYTIQFFENSNTTVGVDTYLRNFEQNLPNFISGSYTFQVVERSSNDAIYEYTVANDPVEPDMHEVARVFSFGNHLFVLRYTMIGPPMDEGYKKHWIKLLKDAKITSGAL